MIVEKGLVENSEETAIGEEFVSDKYASEYWGKEAVFTKLRLLEKTSNDALSIDELLKNGLNHAPQGAVCLSGQLLDYIEKNF